VPRKVNIPNHTYNPDLSGWLALSKTTYDQGRAAELSAGAEISAATER